MASWGGFAGKISYFLQISWVEKKNTYFQGFPQKKRTIPMVNFPADMSHTQEFPWLSQAKKELRDTRHFSTTVQFTMFWYAYNILQGVKVLRTCQNEVDLLLAFASSTANGAFCSLRPWWLGLHQVAEGGPMESPWHGQKWIPVGSHIGMTTGKPRQCFTWVFYML